MSYLEIVAAVFGFLCVGLYILRHMGAWPTGLIQVALLIVVFYDARLYADMLLHGVYVVLQLYGWYAWYDSSRKPAGTDARPSSNNESAAIQVQRLSRAQWRACLASIVAMTLAFWTGLVFFSNADLPFADSLIAAISLVAQYLLAKRYLENWLLWIVVNTLGTAVFAYKGLYPTAILYGLFWWMAIYGFLQWRRSSDLSATDTWSPTEPATHP